MSAQSNVGTERKEWKLVNNFHDNAKRENKKSGKKRICERITEINVPFLRLLVYFFFHGNWTVIWWFSGCDSLALMANNKKFFTRFFCFVPVWILKDEKKKNYNKNWRKIGNRLHITRSLDNIVFNVILWSKH